MLFFLGCGLTRTASANASTVGLNAFIQKTSLTITQKCAEIATFSNKSLDKIKQSELYKKIDKLVHSRSFWLWTGIVTGTIIAIIIIVTIIIIAAVMGVIALSLFMAKQRDNDAMLDASKNVTQEFLNMNGQECEKLTIKDFKMGLVCERENRYRNPGNKKLASFKGIIQNDQMHIMQKTNCYNQLVSESVLFEFENIEYFICWAFIGKNRKTNNNKTINSAIKKTLQYFLSSNPSMLKKQEENKEMITNLEKILEKPII